MDAQRRQVDISSDQGQTLAEYAVVLSIITATIVATIALLAGEIASKFAEAVDVIGSI